MKITNGDKITIKNIGKIAIDIPTFKHNFSYRLSGGESLVFPTNSVEQSLFYLKQKNKILQVTLGNGGEAALVPFTVGQSVSAIKVDTNAKTNEELAAFVAQFDSGSGLDIAFMTYHNNEWPIIDVQGSVDFGYFISTTSNDAGDALMWVSKAMDLDSLKFTSAGWYLVNGDTSSIEKVSGIVELSLGETITVANIDTSFSELNGTVFGAVEGEAPTETLTPFRVGQHINGVTIEPTAKSNEEIINWLNGLTNEQHLVDFNDPNGITVSETNGIKTLTMFLNPIWVNFAADNISAGTSIPKGWSYMTQASGGADITPITERTTLNFDTLEVTQVYSEFDFLNGVAVGVLEAPEPPQETLTPFRVGQKIKGVTVDPNAKSNEEIANWLNTLSYTPDMSTVLMAGRRAGDSNIVEVSDNNGVKTLIFFVDAENFLGFSSDDVPDMNISKGWSRIGESEGNYMPITEKTTFDSNYEITTIAEQFAFLNGTVLGAVEGEVPQETLTPFSKGQNISAIKVNTNAKTNDELSTFAAKALEGQGATKALVSDSVGTKIVGVQGDANYGYIITAASDTNNNILWVSKGLDLDGKFTFPSAGWYSVNENDSTFSETSGIVELPFTGTVTIGENIDAAFNSELNGIVFGVVAA